ncbi:MAG: SRPBCC family protein [Chloroflexota bacterium]|nr:MAG: SRPBCC family protein [Chloroflexota bacterium]
MPTIEREIEIDAPAEALFDLTQDYDRRLLWDPFLKEARLVGGAREAGVGVRAWCVSRLGMGMETEYVSFRRPRVVAVKMTRGPRMIATFAGSWRFFELAPGRTRVVFRYSLTGSPKWLRRLLDPILAWVFSRDIADRLRDLKRVAETTGVLAREVAA